MHVHMQPYAVKSVDAVLIDAYTCMLVLMEYIIITTFLNASNASASLATAARTQFTLSCPLYALSCNSLAPNALNFNAAGPLTPLFQRIHLKYKT
jgi:hypothetical protein